jgi:hypothetical protein
MMRYAFQDAADGYYEVDVPDGAPMPPWTASLTPCPLQPAPAPIFADQRAVVMLDLQQRRDVLVTVITALQGDFLATGDMVNATLAKNIKQGLCDIEAQPAVIAAQTVPALEQAILAAYTALVAGAPLNVKQAFAKYARRVS